MKKLRIASYNIRKAVGLDWRRNGGRIVEVLAEINADIVVLQEADKRIGQRAGVLPVDMLAQDLGYTFADVSVRPQSHGWHGNAILYRPQSLLLSNTQRILLPSLEPRGAISAHFGAPGIEVVGVHLALNRGIRLKQVAALGEQFKSADHCVLIAGDFNTWREDGNMLRLLGTGFTQIAPGNSFHAARPMAALDRFMLKGASAESESFVHQSPLSLRASDHLPIVMDLEY
ncbi:endonuclease/exonuclease/phosphatase family protein [Oceaniglobus ichthyenteri]|uniref:endonuclease/exonuclease/phosphatase family protein n=1 Tax=Oceaniglobus ichthyenteri TaxID=2136177 RepID=UPI000D33F9F6|nr:endonuclease/exonuclease/phosphatase family protein [Oceaniglobus ichthyenteri]